MHKGSSELTHHGKKKNGWKDRRSRKNERKKETNKRRNKEGKHRHVLGMIGAKIGHYIDTL